MKFNINIILMFVFSILTYSSLLTAASNIEMMKKNFANIPLFCIPILLSILSAFINYKLFKNKTKNNLNKIFIFFQISVIVIYLSQSILSLVISNFLRFDGLFGPLAIFLIIELILIIAWISSVIIGFISINKQIK